MNYHLAAGADGSLKCWETIFVVLEAGKMPPEDEYFAYTHYAAELAKRGHPLHVPVVIAQSAIAH